ncbi:MAG: hypothetical protein ACXV7J_05585 [Methylomonas sp.]
MDDGTITTKTKPQLPDSTLALQPVVAEYRRAQDRSKTDWHGRCIASPGYERWRAQQLFKKGVFDLTFSGLAAKVYSDLFELSTDKLPCCTPANVSKVSDLARALSNSLPAHNLLPSNAQTPDFKSGLNSLAIWRPSDLQPGSSRRGDPARRWLICRIAEEFCYSTATKPTTAVIGDLIRLGWPGFPDRSVSNTLTDEILANAMNVANIRRKDENKATTITHQILSDIPNRTRKSESSLPDVKIASDDELSIIAEMESLAAKFPDQNMRKRALSLMRALRDEAGLNQEEADDGN